jgi:hypothetical protein
MQTVKFLERERSSERKKKSLPQTVMRLAWQSKFARLALFSSFDGNCLALPALDHSHSLLSPHNPPSAAVLAAHLVAVHSLTSNPEHSMNCK